MMTKNSLAYKLLEAVDLPYFWMLIKIIQYKIKVLLAIH